jgi:chromosomal replication initiation ATPase DnaA
MTEEKELTQVKMDSVRELLRRVEQLYTTTLDLAVQVGMIEAVAGKPNMIEPFYIIELIQRRLGVNVTRRDRKQETVEARQVAIYLLRKYCRMSLMRIAQYVALSDHSGVIHHLKTVEGYISHDDRIAALIQQFEDDILKHLESMSNEGNSIQKLQGD